MTLMDIATPAALVDEACMMRNIARMQSRMATHGVRLRPHVKTPKCTEVARRQQAAGASGITVSTLKEAEEFLAAGFADVLYAVCIAPAKLDRVLALRRRGRGGQGTCRAPRLRRHDRGRYRRPPLRRQAGRRGLARHRHRAAARRRDAQGGDDTCGQLLRARYAGRAAG